MCSREGPRELQEVFPMVAPPFSRSLQVMGLGWGHPQWDRAATQPCSASRAVSPEKDPPAFTAHREERGWRGELGVGVRAATAPSPENSVPCKDLFPSPCFTLLICEMGFYPLNFLLPWYFCLRTEQQSTCGERLLGAHRTAPVCVTACRSL